MFLTSIEQRFLAEHRRGHLATVGPAGAPQVKPVGFSYNTRLGTIDIAGFNMATSAKYRNVQRNPQVSLVVDDVLFEGDPAGVRFCEVRGTAETVVDSRVGHPGLPPDVIRMHPRRVIAYNIDQEQPGLQVRDQRTGEHAEPAWPRQAS